MAGLLPDWIPAVALLILGAVSVSEGLNCYVCTSVNGSNPSCERPGSNGELPGSALQTGCTSVVGSIDGRTPIQATACMVLMGEYRDKLTNDYKYVVSRKCTGGIRQNNGAKSINCQLFDSTGHLEGDSQFITGCAEACFENKCNGNATFGLANHFRADMKAFISKAQRDDPKTRLRFPSIFAVEETKRLLAGTSERLDSNAAVRVFSATAIIAPILALVLF
ncbi:hypothetical protein BV898_10116 [Hypsibius exemplaris]|uniref:Protein quiver n=1 Tax=Hypsibius exemplaris TaxID=2072580 RepID=A0A1W0WKJ0_HYPEX|nr:hypothetical protein BV898_10116 [Hypsibius exemplaris]